MGGNRIIPTDVRIIAASNEDILELVHQGAFRKDLYYRLNTLPIAIPPLRERGEDLFLIASHLMEKNGVRFTFSPEAKSVLRAYPWEGNVRELANLVEYLSMLGKDQVEVEDLPSYLRESSRPTVPAASIPSGGPPDFQRLAQGREEAYTFLVCALGRSGQGMGRGTLLRLAREQGLPMTEQEIRDMLQALHSQGLVSVSRGRGGSRLTRSGQQLYGVLSGEPK